MPGQEPFSGLLWQALEPGICPLPGNLPGPCSSCLLRPHGRLPTVKKGAADLTDHAVTSTCRAMLSAVENDAQMHLVPALLGKELFQRLLSIGHVFPTGQLSALSETVDVGIHRKGGHAKGL